MHLKDETFYVKILIFAQNNKTTGRSFNLNLAHCYNNRNQYNLIN